MKTTIGDKEVYLAPDDLPEFEYSLLDVTDPSKVRGSSSTTFEVPGSIEAFRVLGGRAIGEEVKTKQSFRINQGSQVLFEGICTPVEWTDGKISVAAFGDNAEWISAAKNTQCVDVDMGVTDIIDANHMIVVWTSEDWDGPFSYRNYCFPLIDYGSQSFATQSTNLPLTSFRFGAQVSSLLKKFFDDNGLTVQVKGELARVWDKLMVPAISNNYRVFDARVIVEASQDQSFFNISQTIAPAFTGIYGVDTLAEDDPAFAVPTQGSMLLPYSGSFFRTTIPGRVSVKFNGTITVRRAAGQATLGQQLKFWLFNQTTQQVEASTLVNVAAGIGDIDVVIDRELFSLDSDTAVTYTVWCSPLPADVGTIFNPQPDGLPVCIMRQGSQFVYEIVDVNNIMQPDVQYHVSSAFPTNFSVGDLISSLSNIFRLSIQTNQQSKTVVISTLDDYLQSIDNGIDWSDRVDETKDVAKVLPSSPYQYRLAYTADEKDELAKNYNGQSQWTAEGVYESGGVDAERLITVKFAPTQQGLRYGNVIVPVLREEDKVTPYIKAKPRLLVYEGARNTGDPVFTFNTVLWYWFPRAYFAGEGGTDINLGFGDDVGRLGTMNRYWRNFLDRSVKPYLRADVVIYDDEFMNFAFGRPRLVHDGMQRSWFYVQKISGKRFGDGTPIQCELIPV
jgi:hypothetical protein